MKKPYCDPQIVHVKKIVPWNKTGDQSGQAIKVLLVLFIKGNAPVWLDGLEALVKMYNKHLHPTTYR